MEKRQELYRGKAKTVFATDDPGLLIMHYRDDTSAFDGAKVAQLPLKGETNNKINAHIMSKLSANGIPTHFVRLLNDRESLVQTLSMIPVECVIRNIVAGSMSKRLGIEEGIRLSEPLFEFFYKNDALHDPLVNDEHVRILGWASTHEIAEMKQLSHRVNKILKGLFVEAGIELVDFKLEFGRDRSPAGASLVLADEFTPDGCRLWDRETDEKMDKDRFRRDLGQVIEKYREVGQRIGADL